jgi:hypothetical protein
VVCESTRAESPCFIRRGQILVGHVSREPVGAYVGRRMRGRQGSPLGNPFKVKSDDERDAAIAQYETWLREKIAAGDREVIGELENLAKRFRQDEWLMLLCWCSPKRCHAEVIATELKERVRSI